MDIPKGRPKKYGEETEMINFRVPKSKIAELKKIVSDFLFVKTEKPSIKRTIEKTAITSGTIKSNLCDCYLDGILLRRGKIKCTLPKSAHNFNSAKND